VAASPLIWLQVQKAWFRARWTFESLFMQASPKTVARRSTGARRSHGPDFVCIGMQKAGTSWLFDQMNGRDDVWMPPIKELNFFTGRCLKPGSIAKIKTGTGSLPLVLRPGDRWRRSEFLDRFRRFQEGRSDVGWYRSLFDLAGDRLTGDVSPGYSKLDESGVESLSEALPDARFLLLVRDPVDRFWSSVCMKVRRNKLNAKDLESWSCFEPNVLEVLMRNPESRDCYGSTIWTSYAKFIHRDRLRYWFFDDIVTAPETVFDEICEYLAICKGTGALDPAFNRKQGFAKLSMPDDIRVNLVKYFYAEYQGCASLFGGHAIAWLERADSLLHAA
jgi:hypothetical protein